MSFGGRMEDFKLSFMVYPALRDNKCVFVLEQFKRIEDRPYYEPVCIGEFDTKEMATAAIEHLSAPSIAVDAQFLGGVPILSYRVASDD